MDDFFYTCKCKQYEMKPTRKTYNSTLVLLLSCLFLLPFPDTSLRAQQSNKRRLLTDKEVINGAERTQDYLPLIRDKRVGLMVNHTSTLGSTHLVDSLKSLGINIIRIFAPEHGFRGELEAGEKFNNQTDSKTGIPIVSLYGDHLKPQTEDLKDIEWMIFDIQDVGVRFYTYASSLQYMMEACARDTIPLLVLDRPNPNGYYVDGPVLKKKQRSFVGLNPVPLVHGLTLAEYARMINEEGWLGDELRCDLRIIRVSGYTHSDFYQLPVPPSPNLPNMAAVYLYPSLGLFEGTKISVGRGTAYPFQFIGYPGMPGATDSLFPVSKPGYSLNPPYKNQWCHGIILKEFGESFLRDQGKIYLFWLLETFNTYPDQKHFFTSYFNRLAGTSKLKKMIRKHKSVELIRESWKTDLEHYKTLRKKYLLYPDFE